MDLSFMEWFLPTYVAAAQLTLTIAVIGIAISVVAGIAASLAFYYRILGLRQLVAVYVEPSCNMPLFVQLLFPYFGLPKIGIRLNPELCGIIGLSFPGGTYMAETFHVGFETVERIQSESALSLDMSRMAATCCVVLPQVVAVPVPSLVANMISLIKEISILSGIAPADLVYVTKDLTGIYYQATEAFLMLVITHLALLLPTSLSGNWAGRRLHHAGFGN